MGLELINGGGKAGTKQGAEKLVETIKARYGEDHWKRMGAKGGKVQSGKTKFKGFGTHRKLASEAGKIGGAKSRKRKAVVA